jgi:hypothetical protein
LRVPKYQKAFEVLFFASFLILYYAVLVERNPDRMTPLEILLYIWIAAFAYDEFSEFRDAGTLFYAADFLTMWDLGIICVGIAFIIASKTLQFDIRFSIFGVKSRFLQFHEVGDVECICGPLGFSFFPGQSLPSDSL